MSLRLFAPRRPLHNPRFQNQSSHSHTIRPRPRIQPSFHQPSHRLQSLRHNSSSSSSTTTTSKRIDRLLSRLPPFLHPYISGLRNAPVSHITAFLILHEITAVLPLVGLATAFHYTHWLPEGWVQARWVNEGVERFGRYFGRKGWFGFEAVDRGSSRGGEDRDSDTIISLPAAAAEGSPVTDLAMDATTAPPVDMATNTATNITGDLGKVKEENVEESIKTKYHASEAGTRILVEVATAYAITKVLLPVRILASVWAAPWFARAVLGRFGSLAGRMRRGGRGGNGDLKTGSGAAGTGATSGGVGGKGGSAGP